MIEKMTQCKNCDSRFTGSFCSACGQKDIDLERPFSELVRNILNETFDLDGRSWRTAKTLFRHPGLLTSEFLAGKRRSYTPPLRLYLFISVTFFILMAWVASQGILLEQGQVSGADAAVQARFMSDDLPRLMFVLLPVFALLLKALFFRRLYFDHLIFSVHVHCAAYVVLAFMVPMENVAGTYWAALAAQLILLSYLAVYMAVALRRVYTTSWIGAGVRTLAVLFGYMVLVSGLIEATSSFQIISD
ncbi:MAG: DUF3667 domain-containing protein [Gammaproteobacteria bacterium]|nr:DUF3667 domain-containing protein [Gammaproteobacteria bacterium]